VSLIVGFPLDWLSDRAARPPRLYIHRVIGCERAADWRPCRSVRLAIGFPLEWALVSVETPPLPMPTYDYLCPSNGRVVEVSHKMAESLETWGELCRKAGIPLDGTPGKARVERLITGGNVITGSLGAKYERPCDTGPCGAPACGGGGCAFE
jgi:hypothetical protein